MPLIALILKGFWKNVTVENTSKAIGMLFFAFLWSMTWVVLGVILFGLVFQWILLLVVPKEFYPYVLNAVITVWWIFGLWYAFVYLPREEKKENGDK